MKKFLFAVQIFSLIMFFPLYVVLELNHTQSSLSKEPESDDSGINNVKEVTQLSPFLIVQDNSNVITGKIINKNSL